MSLLQQIRDERKARLVRLGVTTYQGQYSYPLEAPKPKPSTETLRFDAGWDSMWHYDLVSTRARPPKEVSVKHIQQVVAEHFKVDVRDILAHRRTSDIVLPRHVAMYLTRKLTHRSMPEIGRLFGRRDHTTVLHAIKKVEALCNVDSVMFGIVSQLRRRFI
jgi:hypothetical protein